MRRRAFLQGIGGVAMLLTAARSAVSAGPSGRGETIELLRNGWREYLPRNTNLPNADQPLKRSNAEWKKYLSTDQYRVLRQEGTEPPGSSPLNDEKRPGVFVCAGCDLPLFTSAMKYDSGTGWPSFFTSIPDAFGTKRDFKLILPRTEYHCTRCGGHHGHLFDDGPPPTGKRWCNNGVALRFLPRDSV
jgi:peptide-methionine (R)-S-oxide reductase